MRVAKKERRTKILAQNESRHVCRCTSNRPERLPDVRTCTCTQNVYVHVRHVHVCRFSMYDVDTFNHLHDTRDRAHACAK